MVPRHRRRRHNPNTTVLRPNQRQSLEYDRTVRMRRPTRTKATLAELNDAILDHPVAFGVGIATAGLIVGVLVGRYFFPAPLTLVQHTPTPGATA